MTTAAAAPTVHPIAFSGRTGRRNERVFRTIHLAFDVNEGQTLCGQRIEYVAQQGVVRITIPRGIPFGDLCIACEGRRIESGLVR